jgi:hypothetical protein
MRREHSPSLSQRLERRRLASGQGVEAPRASRTDALPALEPTAGARRSELVANAGPERFFGDLRRNLATGVALACFKRVPEDRSAASFTQVVALSALGLLLAFARDFAREGPAGQFVSWGLPGALFFLPLALCAAWLFAALAGDARRALPVLVGLLALTLPIDLLAMLAHHFLAEGIAAGQAHQAVSGAATLWHAAAAACAGIRLARIPPAGLRRVAGLVVAACVLAVPTTYFERYSALWIPRDDERAASGRHLFAAASEEAFYRQPRLLESQLASLQPGRKGVVDLYFVGVGGWADQDVFMREVQYTRGLFEARFDASGRSVSLINNPKTALETPIASVTALERTLRRIGQIMDREEDIAFLFLTSHGSQDHRFSLEFWPLQLAPLDPARLKSLLAESGIKWKVVVVSACYSGGFVDALKDETTVVITASAADRNSFGCTNEADFTYFGRAYFEEGLRATPSFTAAFAVAREAVTRREAAEEKAPSLPQMHVGAAIGAHLGRFEAQLAGSPAPTPVPPASNATAGR